MDTDNYNSIPWDRIQENSYLNPPPPICARYPPRHLHAAEYLCRHCRMYFCEKCFREHTCSL